MDRHAALRMRFFESDRRWLQQPAPAGEPVPFHVIDVDRWASRSRPPPLASSRRSTSNVARCCVRRSCGAPAFPIACCWSCIIVIDTVSWSVLDDLRAACEHASAGAPIRLAPEATTYSQWVEALSNPADRFDGELILAGDRRARPAPSRAITIAGSIPPAPSTRCTRPSRRR